MKIRCRRRRTSSSDPPPIRHPSQKTRPPVRSPRHRGVQLVRWFRRLRSSSSATGSPDRVSALSGPGTRPGIRPVIQHGQRRTGHHVPVSRCLSATGIRFSVTLFPPGSWALLTVGLPAATGGRTPTGFPRSARMSSDRGGRPLYPEDGGAHPDRGDPRPAPAASQRPVPAPRSTSHRRARLTRHQRGFTRFARPVFPSPVAARMERAALGLSPGLRTPPTKSRTTHAREGTGHEHGPGTTRSTHIRRSPIR